MTHTLTITYRDGTTHQDTLPYEGAELWDLKEMHQNILGESPDARGAIYVIRDAEGREISRYESDEDEEDEDEEDEDEENKITWRIEDRERKDIPDFISVERGKRRPVFGWTDWRHSEIGENDFDSAEEAEQAVEELMEQHGFWMEDGKLACEIRVISSEGDEECIWWMDDEDEESEEMDDEDEEESDA